MLWNSEPLIETDLFSTPTISNMAASNMLQLLSFTVLIAITAIVFGLYNKEQPQPYMDEIFHLPQARNYCVGNLSHWNSKITTLPGLYLVSLMLLRVCNFLPFVRSSLDADQPCSTLFLRFINLLFMIGNFWLLYELSVKINSNVSKEKILCLVGRKRPLVPLQELCR